MTRSLLIAMLATAAFLPSQAEKPRSAPDDTPFYQGVSDEGSLTRIVDARLTRAKQLHEQLLTVPGKRTPENTLRVYDNLMLELQNAGVPEGGGVALIVQGLHPDARMRATATQLVQRVAAFESEISLDRRVFGALAAIDLSGASPDTRHYVEQALAEYRREGIDRDEATRAKLRQLRGELVSAAREWRQNIIDGVRQVEIDSAAELDGLPADYVAAHPAGPNGKVTLTTQQTDVVPVMLYAKSNNLRSRMYLEVRNVAYPANVPVLRRLLDVRFQIARLLGYPDCATYSLEDRMAGTPAKAREFIDRIVAASESRFRQEYESLVARKRQDQPDARALMGWENQYYTELVRRAKYDLDTRELRPYFAYERVRDGLLRLATTLFGFEFVRVSDAPVWHPSVEVYRVAEDGSPVGRLYLDTHPRPGKAALSGGTVRYARKGVAGVQSTEVVLMARLPGGQQDDPGLMTHNQMNLFFHEFGHALHGLAAGRRNWIVPRFDRDFIEAPSQLLEEWVVDPKVLATFATHYQTGEPIPPALVQRFRQAEEMMRGTEARSQMASAKLSLSLHDRDPGTFDIDVVAREVWTTYMLYELAEGSHGLYSTPWISTPENSAAYYNRMWSLVIAKDLFSQFDRSNLLDPKVPRRYKTLVLAPGPSKPAAQLIQDFLGRPFNLNAWENWVNEPLR